MEPHPRRTRADPLHLRVPMGLTGQDLMALVLPVPPAGSRQLRLAHVAVGTGVASCPPRRSRRAAFCFAAPSVSAPGSCRRSNATGIRGLGGPSSSGPWTRAVGDMPVPALCPGHALALALPSTGRLPSTLSAPDPSVGVVRGFIGTLQPSDSSDLPVRLRLLAFPNRPGTALRLRAAGGLPGSDTILDGSNWSQTPVERRSLA